MPQRNRQSLQGFTLIEVLVVIGIIGLLAAILLPSLARSRENARSVKCRSNLKQWGSAMLMYTNIHKGVLPFEERPSTVPSDNPDVSYIEDENGDRVWDNPKDEHGQAPGWICWFDVLNTPQYMGGGKNSAEVATCPSVRLYDAYSEESYRMNSKLADSTRIFPSGSMKGQSNPYYAPFRKLDTLRRPADTVALFDGDVGKGDVAPGMELPTPSFKGRWRDDRAGDNVTDDVNYRHNNATNILFCDFHVGNLKKKVLFQKSIRNSPIIWQPHDMGLWDPAPQ